MNSPHILVIDGYNFIHRARSGFQLGQYHIVFNFFRNLRSLVDQFKPSRVYFTLEGCPTSRLESLSTYKANRAIDTTDHAKVAAFEDFNRQKKIIVDLLSDKFPISVVKHPDLEADDLIYNLINRSTTAIPWTVVSNDSDFTQLLNQFNHVQVYNPMKKTFVDRTEYDYVTWKALRGDSSDNIPGIEGVGNKKAEKLARDENLFRQFFTGDQGEIRRAQWNNNYNLIHFIQLTDEKLMSMWCSSPVKDWEYVKMKFKELEFNSLIADKAWTKYMLTFDGLWG